jgi:hypothetical protein
LGGGGSGGPGSPGESGVDCACDKTGEFVNPMSPAMDGAQSSDGVYRVEEGALGSTTSVAVIRNSDDKRVFFQGSIKGNKAFGFGPKSRYFLIALQETATSPTNVIVWDLEDEHREILQTVHGSGGWGFSPDGRTLMLASNSAGSLAIVLRNLDTHEQDNFNTLVPYFASFSFSPCGDIFATGIAPASTGKTKIRLYRTYDVSVTSDPLAEITGFWPGLETTDTQHRTKGTTIEVGANTAGAACE